MNRTVSTLEVGGFQLRIKDANTNASLGNITTYNWNNDINSPEVVFDLGNASSKTSIAGKLNVGYYYKIQIAYIDSSMLHHAGYFSTICIVKFTNKPKVYLAHLNRYMTNTDVIDYTGVYSNSDTSEKAYQYMFTLRDSNGTVLENSGWLTHNSNTDTEQGQSQDLYTLMHAITPDDKYTMQYSVLTTNKLRVDSPRYQIVGSTSILPELDAFLIADPDYENGCINLTLQPKSMGRDKTTGEKLVAKLSGSFVLTRSSAEENFAIWTRLYAFTLTGRLPDGALFTDHTIEQGQIYKYAIQQYNEHGIFSSRIYASYREYDEFGDLVPSEKTEIVATFEDMFLYDGEKQLRIRFNPKVSSFKTTLSESKKTTIGSKYPFFFRNGITQFKEFPISGLISYMIDDNEYFLDRVDDLNMPIDWTDITDITDENLTYERKFKLAVLDWLNDGQIKLFRSPGEGNYLVRLMNVQLTPNDSLSRMIHTFQCQATEVDDCNASNLSKYGFLKADPTIPMQLRFGTIVLDEFIEEIIEKITHQRRNNSDEYYTVADALEMVKTQDLLNGWACQYLKIEECWPHTEFELEGNNFYIGSTGQYEASFTDKPYGLYLKNPRRHMQGIITYGVLTSVNNQFDTVVSLTQSDVFQFLDYQGGSNFIEDNTFQKSRINKIYFMHFYLNDLIYDFESLEHFQNMYGMYMQIQHEENIGDETDQNGILICHLRGVEPISEEYHYLDEYYHKVYNEQTNTFYYEYIQRGAGDLYVDNTLIRMANGDIYRYTLKSDFDYYAPDPLHGGGYYTNAEHFGIAGIMTKLEIDEEGVAPSQVIIDNDVIDISITKDAYLPMTERIPEVVRWGEAVRAEICYQRLTIDYGPEFNEKVIVGKSYSMKDLYDYIDELHKYYDASILRYDRWPGNINIINLVRNLNSDPNMTFYVWKPWDRFYRLEDEERLSFTGEEVWIPCTGWKFDANDEWEYADGEIISGASYYVPTNPVVDYNSVEQPTDGPGSYYPHAIRQYDQQLIEKLAEEERELNLDGN